MLSKKTLESFVSIRVPELKFKFWDYNIWRPIWSPGCDWAAEIRFRMKQARLAALLNDDWYAGVTWQFLKVELQLVVK